MGRQLFLHHYLPAHLASALVAGALLEFIFNMEPLDASDRVSDAFSRDSGTVLTTDGSANRTSSGTHGGASGKKRRLTDGNRKLPVRERLGQQNLWASWAATGVVVAVLVWGFLFYAPLTYGAPGLSVEQVIARKWLAYDLHFAK